MLSGLTARGNERARERAEAVRDAVARRLGEAVPGVAITAEDERIVLSGHAVARRYGASSGLRWRITEAVHDG